MDKNKQQILETIQSLGAHKVALAEVKDIPFDTVFRKACEANSCGMYGRSWMCPPDVGDIEELIQQAKSYENAAVYQTISQLEDSYDFEGMMEAGQLHNNLAQAITKALEGKTSKAMHLGAGGCRVCERCAKQDNLPCYFPDKAMSSLEAYGISVSELAALCGMNYINGENTVTYFGAYFF